MLSIFTTLIVGLSTLNASDCSVENVDYVKRHFVENKLSFDAEVIQENSDSKLKNAVVCAVKNELMLDGLSFVLFQHDESKSSYISVLNGLDGTSRLYGPFAY